MILQRIVIYQLNLFEYFTSRLTKQNKSLNTYYSTLFPV